MQGIKLRDGSRIAIIGGGPAGALFAHFVIKYTSMNSLNPEITIFDGKDFLMSGPKGCNLCAGIISDSLRQKFEKEGIFLPEGRIVNRLDGYIIHGDEDTLELSCADNVSDKISAVFRGNGPRFSAFPEVVSFDDFLLAMAQDAGGRVVSQPVQDIQLPSDRGEPVTLIFGKEDALQKCEADLVVGAFGVNSFFQRKIQKLDFGFRPPSTLSIYQGEIMLGQEEVLRKFGNFIHVFMRKSKNLRFASLVPKGDYISLTLIGKKNATPELFDEFMDLKDIQGLIPRTKPQCFCYPKIVTGFSKKPYADRLLLIGDAAFSRHYKNGIESAFLTAKLAAETAVFAGIDASSIAADYMQKAERLIRNDNFYGKLLFRINHFTSSVPILARSHFILAANCSERESPKKMRFVLWNMLTGNVPYKRVFKASLSCKLQLELLCTILKLTLQRMKKKAQKFKQRLSFKRKSS